MEAFFSLLEKVVIAYAAISLVWVLKQPIKHPMRESTDQTSSPRIKVNGLSKKQAEEISHLREAEAGRSAISL